MNDTTKVLSSNSVFHAKLFDVVEEDILYPTGRQVTHHNIIRKPTVSIFPITENYEIYLVSEYRYLLGKTVLSSAAGFMDKDGETPLDTAKREAKEELGIIAHQWEQLAHVTLGSSVLKASSYLFLARDIEFGEQALEEDEEIEVVSMPLEEAIEKVMLGEINNSATMIGILMLENMRKDGKL